MKGFALRLRDVFKNSFEGIHWLCFDNCKTTGDVATGWVILGIVFVGSLLAAIHLPWVYIISFFLFARGLRMWSERQK